MGDISSHLGTVRFVVYADEPPAEERSLFALPEEVVSKDVEIEVHDMKASEELVKGAKGLDAQGFTYVEHQSKLMKDDSWFEGSNLEDVYFQELYDLICNLTGAKHARALNAAIRRKSPDNRIDPNYGALKGGEFDQAMDRLPRNVTLIVGRDPNSNFMSPVRVPHCDYTTHGLGNSLRYGFKDLREMGAKAIEAEDAAKRGQDVKVPRYAVYSLWRPLKPVKRDRLAVTDWRTLAKRDFKAFSFRALSEVNESGEYLIESCNMLPPDDPLKHRWYDIPDQQPHELLVIKLADSESEKNPNVAGGVGHCAPAVKGEEDEEIRESIEVRVLAVWE